MINREYLRNVVFGFEDGFVSSVGSLVGIAASTQQTTIVVVSGVVIIAVEAFSMGIGGYLTEKSVRELEDTKYTDNLLIDGFLMWFSYMIAGTAVLLPYVFIRDPNFASITSVAGTLIGLFLLGFVKAVLTKKSRFKSGFEMMLIAGLAIGIGFVIGEIASQFLPI